MSTRRPDPADRLRAALAIRAVTEEAETDAWPGADLEDDAREVVRRDEASSPGRHAASDPPRSRRLDRTDPPPVVSWPVGLRDRFAAVPHPVVLTFLALAVIAGGVFGARVVSARAEATPVPVASVAVETPASSGATPSSGSGPASSAGEPTVTGTASSTGPPVIVHVVGQVARPGVVSLPAGSRVEDAVEKAGGATGKADLGAVNLARLCVDGEQIRIPKPGEVITAPGGSSPGGSPSGPSGSSGQANGKVSLNTADATALDTLPGVGPVLAQRILDWRAEHGRFSSIDELGEVSGIGEKLLAQLSPLVTL
ncbi:ComEA family DNA-binding protein [Nostocoides vanveenii]|uniref:ComEA family DNA-binding protein n=1 Tax=Nostocoides vanveenii TaxID=330835 RepID=A0ABN2KJX5_9MICO